MIRDNDAASPIGTREDDMAASLPPYDPAVGVSFMLLEE